MRLRITALILLLFVILFPLRVLALELNFEGQKDFWTDVYLQIIADELTGQKTYLTDWSYGQSFDLHFQGEDEMSYVRGYITDNPQLMDQTFLDVLIKDYTLQWNNYDQAFAVPSWFNMNQKFTGLRAGFMNSTDRINLSGVQGDMILREDDILITPGAEKYGISLFYAPVSTESFQIWLDNRELTYYEDYVVDYNLGIVQLKFPVVKPGVLHVKYFQEGQGYLVFGGRYDHAFSPKLEGGGLMMLARGEGINYGLLGSEWIYHYKPWWTMELNAGLVLQTANPLEGDLVSTGYYNELTGDPVVNDEDDLVSVQEDMNEKISDNLLSGEIDDGWKDSLLIDTNWRIANYFELPGMEMMIDYQVIENNMQNLLFGGWEGKKLSISGQYEKDNFFIRHQQNHQWTLDNYLFQRDGELEMVYFTEHWIPYLYYSLQEQSGYVSQHGIAELGYMIDLMEDLGSMTYQLGVDIETSPEEGIWHGLEPYLGVRYDKNVEDSLGARIYGQRGGKFAQLIVDGKWSEGPLEWKGNLHYLPEYYRIEQGVVWNDLSVDVNLNSIYRKYFADDDEYLNLELNLDWSTFLEEQAMVWVSLLRDRIDGELERNYKIGFEKAILDNLTGYGEISIGDIEQYYSGGIRGSRGPIDYDVNYTWSKSPDLIGSLDILTQKNKVAFSAGILDFWNTYGEVEIDNLGQWQGDLGVQYPIQPQLDVGLQYSVDKIVDYSHQMTLRTVYHF